MGGSFSCPFAAYGDVDNSLESLLVESRNLGDNEIRRTVRSVSFHTRNTELTILKSPDSGGVVVEEPMAFIWRKLKEMISDNRAPSNRDADGSVQPISIEGKQTKFHSSRSDSSVEITRDLPILDPDNEASTRSDSRVGILRDVPILDPQHEAATRLQKVYRSFRTRRKLADCAVFVEQSWWKLLDFAELKQSSISFFDIEKHETAVSRWSRAKKRVAKVGKGLSKNNRAQKLALQHWLEAIDPRHRYGHNLHFYYKKWLQSQSIQPFFYWLDIGEGKEVSLERCPRSKLQQQCIKYLGPTERKAYEVILKDGKFYYKQTGDLLHAADKKEKWIFVLSTSKNLYVGKKKKGHFQHSSFLAGGVTTAAGRLIVENGILKAIWPHSGHYQPTEENFQDFQDFLRENNVDLTNVKMSPADDEEHSPDKKGSSGSPKSDLSGDNGSEPEEANDGDRTEQKNDSVEEKVAVSVESPKSQHLDGFRNNLPQLEIPTDRDRQNIVARPILKSYSLDSPVKELEEGNEAEVVDVPEESILRRINSHKEMRSYQLGKQLSCKWTSGAGPRIGCVRDYPSQLQHQALELMKLSPTTTPRLKSSSCGSISQ